MKVEISTLETKGGNCFGNLAIRVLQSYLTPSFELFILVSGNCTIVVSICCNGTILIVTQNL